MMRYGYGFDMMNGGWLGGLLTLLFGALIVAGIVLIIVWAVRKSSGHAASGPTASRGDAGHDEAVAIAKRRLASGDITKEQYDELIRVLG
ncbi:MAG: SHOCT domain-containing protein [Coriobacteriia bacterium]